MTLRTCLLAASALAILTPATAQQRPAPAAAPVKVVTDSTVSDIPPNFTPPTNVAERDYDKREIMVPMRDGTKLYTVIVVPKGAVNAPIVLTRTPYNAAGRAKRSDSTRMIEALPLADEEFVKAGYIASIRTFAANTARRGIMSSPAPSAAR